MAIFSFLVSLILGVALSLLTVYLSLKYAEERTFSIPLFVTTLIRAAIFFAVPFLCNYFAPRLATPVAVSVLLGLSTLGLMAYLVYWWKENGSTIKELVVTIFIDAVLSMLANAAFSRCYDLNWLRGIIGFVMAVPYIVLFMSIGYFIANLIWWHGIEKYRIMEEGIVDSSILEGGEDDEYYDEEYEYEEG